MEKIPEKWLNIYFYLSDFMKILLQNSFKLKSN